MVGTCVVNKNNRNYLYDENMFDLLDITQTWKKICVIWMLNSLWATEEKHRGKRREQAVAGNSWFQLTDNYE